jgi:hypothetical protein
LEAPISVPFLEQNARIVWISRYALHHNPMNAPAQPIGRSLNHSCNALQATILHSWAQGEPPSRKTPQKAPGCNF